MTYYSDHVQQLTDVKFPFHISIYICEINRKNLLNFRKEDKTRAF